MAAGAFTVYSNAAFEMSKGSFDLSTDTYIIALLTGSYSPQPNTDSTWANVSSYELPTGNGYTQGGATLGSISNTLSGATVTFTSAAPSWTGFSATFKYAAIVRRASGTLQSTDLLLCYVDCNTSGGTITGDGGTLTITPNAAGIFTVTHTP